MVPVNLEFIVKWPIIASYDVLKLEMTILDYAVFSILAISIVLSIVRGMVRELLSLVSWVIAFMVANSFVMDFIRILPLSITGESFRMLISFSALFLSTLLVMSMFTILVSSLIRTAGLGLVDRFFGALFGFVRGALIVLLMTLLAGLTSFPQESFWKKAALRRSLETAATIAATWLPYDLSKQINYKN